MLYEVMVVVFSVLVLLGGGRMLGSCEVSRVLL